MHVIVTLTRKIKHKYKQVLIAYVQKLKGSHNYYALSLWDLNFVHNFMHARHIMALYLSAKLYHANNYQLISITQTHTYIHVYKYVCVYIYMCVYIYIFVYVCVCVYKCKCVCALCACMHVYILYIHTLVYVHAHAHTATHIQIDLGRLCKKWIIYVNFSLSVYSQI